jgi:hypothetical protein
MEAVVVKKSTGEVINYNYNVLDPSQPIQGLDPDLEVLLKYTPYDMPDYDSRIYKLVVTEEITTTPHPDYSNYNQFRKTYATQKRTNEEISLAVQNAESLANEQLISTNERLKLLALGLASCIRRLNGVNWSKREVTLTNNIVNKAIKMFRNDEELQRKLDQIAAGEEPNLDEGWESDE